MPGDIGEIEITYPDGYAVTIDVSATKPFGGADVKVCRTVWFNKDEIEILPNE